MKCRVKIKKKNAFTILELLISLFFSSFIILAMIQIYRTVFRSLDKSESLQQVDRKVCLTLNQLERDLSSAFIPFLHEKEKKNERKKITEFKKTEKKQDKNYFVARCEEDQFLKIEDQKKYLFKSLNFITTNPLQVYGQKLPRLVRVKYELIKDKVKSRQTNKDCYNFFRLETADLSNFELKKDEDFYNKNKKYSVVKHLLLSNIKNMIFEYVTLKTQKDKDKGSGFRTSRYEEEQVLKKFSWQNEQSEKKDDETTEKVPRQIELWFTFWDEKFLKEYNFKAMIPIFSYPTMKLDSNVTTTLHQKKQQNRASLQQRNISPRPVLNKPNLPKPKY